MNIDNSEVATEGTPIASSVPAAEETKTSYDGAEIRGARREESKPEPKDDKPAGYKPVDLSGLPPEVKERVDYLYRQVKDNDRTVREYRQIAAEQSRQIQELATGFNGVVTHLQDKNIDDSEETITTQMNAAFERGDNKAYLEAQKKLINLGVEKRIIAEKKTVQQPQQRQQAQPMDAREIANRAQSEGELSPNDYRTTEAWQNEKDESGNFIRPWSRTPDVNNPDPMFVQALTETKAVFTNSRFSGLSYEEKLAEVDRRMGVAKRVTSQTVTGGGLNGRAKMSKVTLSPDIEKLAIRTRFGGPKAKTDAEHIEAYRKQLEKVKGKR